MVRLGCSTAADSKHRLRFRFPDVALFSTTAKCLVTRTLYYVSVRLLCTSHFNALFTV